MNFSKKIILFLFLSINLSIYSQKEVKEGIITMKITMSSENKQINTSLAMLGDMSTTVYFKDNKSRTEMKSPMTGESTTIIDSKTNDMIVLMDNPMLGKKYLKSNIKVSEEDLKNVTIKETGDSKTILGYKCKGYNINVNKDSVETKMTMYITDKILAPNQNSSILGGKIVGYPMLMVMDMKQGEMPMSTTMEVIDIKNEKIDNSKFDMTIPEGYEEMATEK